MPKVGATYRHYKGNEYTILCIAKVEADLTDVVVYRDMQDATKIWVRPLSMFMEKVEVNGQKVPRFQAL